MCTGYPIKKKNEWTIECSCGGGGVLDFSEIQALLDFVGRILVSLKSGGGLKRVIEGQGRHRISDYKCGSQDRAE